MEKLNLLHELDDRLSVVKRWGIVRTINQQSVAEHCFNVQRICMNIAPWFGITAPEELFELSQAALHHDDTEAVTGDIPGPAKAYVRTKEGEIVVSCRVWYDRASDRIKEVVKLADLLEAYHFLSMEMRMGNNYIRNHWDGLADKIMRYIDTQPLEVVENCHSWMVSLEHKYSKIYPEKP